jgi:hypothetical protein
VDPAAEIADFALKHRLPAAFNLGGHVEVRSDVTRRA